MIRDPSDGSVREKLEGAVPNTIEPKTNAGKARVVGVRNRIDSGLPMESTKPKHIQRLEKSRKQLEQFRKTGVWDDAT